MFIWSIRASSLKFIIACTLCVTVLGAFIFVLPYSSATDSALPAGNVNFDGINSPEDVVNFIRSFGWEVKSTPPVTEEVTIPDEFDKVFVNYNEIQKKQGLDLSKYKRKKVTRYTYELSNYNDYQGTVYANVIVYRGRVIAGDICSASPDGFVLGFSGE